MLYKNRGWRATANSMADKQSKMSSAQLVLKEARQITEPPTPPPEYEDYIGTEKVPPACASSHVDDVSNVDWPLITRLEKEAEAGSSPPDYSLIHIDGKDEEMGEEETGEVDPWKMTEIVDNGPSWSELDTCGKIRQVLVGYIGKFLVLLALLYFFICSLDFLSSGFRLVGGKAAGEAFRSNTLLQNPVAGLMIGIVATVLVQSSSTSTSIVVTMVASGIMDVRPAIPIVMGANIGTSVTNTIVSMSQSADRNQFRRAFAGATVHDMFNWLSVIVLLPIEAATGFLYHTTLAATAVARQYGGSQATKKDLLKTLTKPFTKLVIQLDKTVLEAIATGDEEKAQHSLVKKWCKYDTRIELANVTKLSANATAGMAHNATMELANRTVKIPTEPCVFLLRDTGMSDTMVGFLLLAVSLILLCGCLVLMVKVLQSMLQGRIAKIIRSTLNSDSKGCLSYLSGYVAIVIGAIMTILVQSSSVFTSAMTPLVGLGIIEIERMYPLTLGSNIGTTATGILAALTAPSDKLAAALQIAFSHLFFNIAGILLFFPIPAMRFPIGLAKLMGNTTADYRWFAIFYLVMMFFILPTAVFTLSMLGLIPFAVIFGSFLMISLIIIAINIVQVKKPAILPGFLRNWEFLPECLHSLDPMDRAFRAVIRAIRKIFPCCKPKKPYTPRTPIVTLPESVAREMTESAQSSVNSSATSSQATSVCSSRSTSMLIIPSNAKSSCL